MIVLNPGRTIDVREVQFRRIEDGSAEKADKSGRLRDDNFLHPLNIYCWFAFIVSQPLTVQSVSALMFANPYWAYGLVVWNVTSRLEIEVFEKIY